MLARAICQRTGSAIVDSVKYLLKLHVIALVQKRSAAHAHRTNYVMDKVYLSNYIGSEELNISFRYTSSELRLDRDFNFSRNINEKVEDALSRMRKNIEKQLNKRANKTKKKLPDTDTDKSSLVAVDVAQMALQFERLDGSCLQSDVTFSEMLSANAVSDLQLRVIDRIFAVVLNVPWVVNMVLPTSILAEFIVYPSKLDMQFAERAHCRSSWYKAKMPPSGDLAKGGEWQHCGDGLIHTTSNDDVGHYLKLVLTPGNSAGVLGPPVETIAKNEVQAGPGPCPFETRNRFTTKYLDGDSMRIVSYNILADLYADSDYTRTHLFPYCAPYALKIEYRRQLFLKEILGYNADIVCLQEVDMKVFDLDLQPVMGAPKSGFKGVIAQKGTSGEGVATFYRDKRYELIAKHDLNIGKNIRTLPEFAELWQKIASNEQLAERICARSTTLQLSVLKCKENDRFLLVANTHLYFHPDADHIRLLQIGFSMLYVQHIYQRTLRELKLEKEERRLALVFCGDFNSVPECGIYKLMTEKFVDKDSIDWSSNESEAVKDVTLSQQFNLRSACGTPTYTNYTHAFAACLDYIFYQYDRLEVQQVVPLPTDDELKAHIAIPSVVFPSDHVALVADLQFKAI